MEIASLCSSMGHNASHAIAFLDSFSVSQLKYYEGRVNLCAKKVPGLTTRFRLLHERFFASTRSLNTELPATQRSELRFQDAGERERGREKREKV